MLVTQRRSLRTSIYDEAPRIPAYRKYHWDRDLRSLTGRLADGASKGRGRSAGAGRGGSGNARTGVGGGGRAYSAGAHTSVSPPAVRCVAGDDDDDEQATEPVVARTRPTVEWVRTAWEVDKSLAAQLLYASRQKAARQKDINDKIVQHANVRGTQRRVRPSQRPLSAPTHGHHHQPPKPPEQPRQPQEQHQQHQQHQQRQQQHQQHQHQQHDHHHEHHDHQQQQPPPPQSQLQHQQNSQEFDAHVARLQQQMVVDDVGEYAHSTTVSGGSATHTQQVPDSSAIRTAPVTDQLAGGGRNVLQNEAASSPPEPAAAAAGAPVSMSDLLREGESAEEMVVVVGVAAAVAVVVVVVKAAVLLVAAMAIVPHHWLACRRRCRRPWVTKMPSRLTEAVTARHDDDDDDDDDGVGLARIERQTRAQEHATKDVLEQAERMMVRLAFAVVACGVGCWRAWVAFRIAVAPFRPLKRQRGVADQHLPTMATLQQRAAESLSIGAAAATTQLLCRTAMQATSPRLRQRLQVQIRDTSAGRASARRSADGDDSSGDDGKNVHIDLVRCCEDRCFFHGFDLPVFGPLALAHLVRHRIRPLSRPDRSE
jgi:hypothetical protein